METDFYKSRKLPLNYYSCPDGWENQVEPVLKWLNDSIDVAPGSESPHLVVWRQPENECAAALRPEESERIEIEIKKDGCGDISFYGLYFVHVPVEVDGNHFFKLRKEYMVYRGPAGFGFYFPPYEKEDAENLLWYISEHKRKTDELFKYADNRVKNE